MQTFLPYPSFERSAAALDLRRLGKQRVETLQILRAVTFDDYGWRNHPAVTMWVGFTEALVAYGMAVTRRWQAEGFRDTVGPQLVEFLVGAPLRSERELARDGLLPPWVGSRPLHRSHQAALLRKDAEHYRPLFGNVDPDLPYVWPPSAPRAPRTSAVSAWVVRAPSDGVAVLVDAGIVGLRPLGDESAAAPAGKGTRNTKRRRQITALVEEIAGGDVVVVPEAGVLHVGQILGDYEWRDDAPGGIRHVRRVRWRETVAKATLRRPVHLQDPRLVFALHDEPELAATPV